MRHPLEECIEGEPGFSPIPWYNADGDCLEYVWANEGIVAERVNNLLTLYHSTIDDKLIGFKIKDIAGLLRDTYGPLLHEKPQDGTKRVVQIRFDLLIVAALRRMLRDQPPGENDEKVSELVFQLQTNMRDVTFSIPKEPDVTVA